jgi:hypothetical protein
MIYALNPNRNISISSPAELVDEQHPRKYLPFRWPEFISNLRANRHRIRDKLALDFVKITETGKPALEFAKIPEA